MTYSILVAVALVAAGETSLVGEEPSTTVVSQRVAEVAESEMLAKPWEGQYRAMTHARYHLAEAAYYKAWDTAARASTLFVSALSMMGSVVWFAGQRYIRRTWIFAAGIAFSFSLALNLSQWDIMYNDHAVMAKRWSSLELDWERLRHKKEDLRATDLALHIKKLNHDERTIENAEYPPHESLSFLRKAPSFTEFRREFDRSASGLGDLSRADRLEVAE